MMTLFGGFSHLVFEAYDEVLPLAPGWRDRNALYQLYHLLNHLNLFGSGYHAQVMAVVARYV
jgi:protein-ribulosamine 3-kinase